MENSEHKKRLVSVIVPCFNHAHFLPETLDCLLDQTYRDWECIIVDDGSTDGTGEIAREYARKDGRFSYLYQENGGLPSARNNGIRNANGDLIQLLDSDDLIDADKLAVQVGVFAGSDDIDIAYGEYVCFTDADRNKTWTYSRVLLGDNPAEDLASQWEKGLSIPIHCFLYARDCFSRWGMFDEGFINGKEDWDLHLRFAMGGAKFLFVPGALARYRVSEKSMVRSDQKAMLKGKRDIFVKYMTYPKSSLRIRFVFLMRYAYLAIGGGYKDRFVYAVSNNARMRRIIGCMKKK